jgi:hypothetical protein
MYLFCFCCLVCNFKNCGARETAIASEQQLSKHISAAADTQAIIELLLEMVFSTMSVQRGYKEDNLGNQVSSVWESVRKRGS